MSTFFSQLYKDARNRWKSMFQSDLQKAALNWFKIRELKYAPTNKENIFDLSGRKIHYRNGLELLHSLLEIYVAEVYKMEFDMPDPYILDCGANIGLSTLYLKDHFPKARIVAFEPDEANFDLLKKNVAGIPDVEIVKKAVWKENGIIPFANDGTLGSKIVSEPGTEAASMACVRLKDYLDKPINFLKLDIEGAEYEVLTDCSDKMHMVKNLFIEYHGDFQRQNQLNEILQILEEHQFSYYIKEAANTYQTPFVRKGRKPDYDIQLNIFCFRE